MKEISPLELKLLLDSGKRILLLDVRQPEEHELVGLPDSILIPLGELVQRFRELEDVLGQGWDVFVVYCRTGGRSRRAIDLILASRRPLLDRSSPLSLKGGINAYAAEVDPSYPMY